MEIKIAAALSAVAAAIVLSGCASASKAVATSGVSATRYARHDCNMLAAEYDLVTTRARTLGARLDEAAKNDQGIAALSLILFWPAAFALGNKEQEAEYAYIKGQIEAIEQTAVLRKCPPLSLPMAMEGAAPTPVAELPRAVPAALRPVACDWPVTTQGVGACK